MKYTVENFKPEGEASKKSSIEFMVAKEDGTIDTEEVAGVVVNKGNYIIQGYSNNKPRVWVTSDEYFKENYKIND